MQATDHLSDNLQAESPLDSSRWMQYLQVFVMLGLAIYFAYNIISGNLTNYINERFVWLSYVAVGIFFALGIANAVAVLRNAKRDYGQEDYTHQKITWTVIFVASIPLLLGVLVPSRPLGAEAVNGSISLTVAAAESSNVASASKDPLQRNVLDWLRVFSQNSAASAFNGEQADVIGFVYREPGFPEDHFMVARFTVACCVADAGAIGIPVNAPGSDEIPDGEWVRVAGVFQAETFRNASTPVLQAATLEVVEQPEHPYLYP